MTKRAENGEVLERVCSPELERDGWVLMRVSGVPKVWYPVGNIRATVAWGWEVGRETCCSPLVCAMQLVELPKAVHGGVNTRWLEQSWSLQNLG